MASPSGHMSVRSNPSLNYVCLSGNLGKDAKVTSGGAFINVAINKFYKDKEGAVQSSTCWRTVYIKNPLAASISKYLTKGKTVIIIGEMDTWKPKTPEDKPFEVIVAAKVILLDRPGAFADEEAVADPGTREVLHDTHRPYREAPDMAGPIDDDIPF